MWNLEKWYRRSHFQSRNRDTHVGNTHTDTTGKWGGGVNWKNVIDMYTLLFMKQSTNENLRYSTEKSFGALW